MTTQRQSQALKTAFLAAFRETGVVTHAAERAGISRSQFYNWRDHDPAFSTAFAEAELESTERLEAEAYRRAHDGHRTERGVYHNGQLIATEVETKHSDLLLIFLLKARKPTVYREKLDVQHSGEVRGGDTLTVEQREAVRAALLGRSGGGS